MHGLPHLSGWDFVVFVYFTMYKRSERERKGGGGGTGSFSWRGSCPVWKAMGSSHSRVEWRKQEHSP